METNIVDKFCGSSFWDSNLTWNTDTPQLTPCFEKTALVWFPSVFLWVFSSIDLYCLFSYKTRNIPLNWRSYGKLVVLLLLIVSCIVEFFYNLSRIDEVFPVDIYTPVIKVVTVSNCSALVLLHRKYGRRSSGILFIFWFLVVVLGFSQFYSELSGTISRNETEVTRISYIVYYCSCVIMFLLHCILDLPPLQPEYSALENTSPEEFASFPSRVTFSWFDSLVYLGFKRPLVANDLWSLRYQNTSEGTFSSFDKHWKMMYDDTTKTDLHIPVRLVQNENSTNVTDTNIGKYKPSILPALCKAFGSTYLLAAGLELVELLLRFLSPLLLKCMIGFTEGNEPHWRGYLYASLLLLVTTLTTLFQNQYMRLMAILGLRIKSALISAIYRKALKLSNSPRKEYTVGEIDILMSVDADMFAHAVYFLNTLWSTPLQITLCLFFLWQLLGPCVLVGLAVMVVLMPVNGFIAKRSEALQSKLMQTTSERAKMMSEILSGIKVLKLYAWEPSFEKRVLKIRGKEINILKKEAYLNSVALLIFSCTPFFISLLTFATYALSSQENILDSLKIFVSLSLFNMLDTPLAMVASMMSKMIQISVSVKRINKFLNSEELDPAVVSHDEVIEPLVIENGTFLWDIEEEPVLRDINLKVKPGSLAAVVGVVGSGKSSLISAFLGEMYKLSGTVNSKGSIAYVPQVAWIQNCTLQDNILFSKPLDPGRYQKVIDACALKADLEILPGGDQTEIGDRGINLSGGQKQRVSLARAVYSDCDIYLLDDPLSAVDSHVGKHIFDNVIGSEGILKGKTRLFVTHSVTFLNEVDLIVVVKDKTISEMGTYQELLEKNGEFSNFIKTYSEQNNGDGKDFDPDVTKPAEIGDEKFQHNFTFQNSVESSSSSVPLQTGRKLSEVSKSSDESGSYKMIEEEQVQVGGVIGILIVASYSTPIFMTVIIPIGLLYYCIQRFYINTSLQLRRLESISTSPVYSHFGESVTGSSVIRAYQAQDRFIKRLEEKVDFSQTCFYSSSMAGLWLAVRLQVIGNLIIFFAALFSVISHNSLSAGLVGLSISYTLEITDALDMLMFYTTELETDIVAVERIKEYSNTPQEASWDISTRPVGETWPLDGEVEFIDFKVRYREGLDLVLKGLDFKIRAGEKVGIVGRTGAGKSSVTLSLFRIIESAGGKILIDGVDIAELGLHTLRSRLTIIPQDPVLFSGSLRMNLDPFDLHSDDQIWRALELAHLKPFVQELAAQLQHEVSEGGSNLSVGQRQLLCLARALLSKRKILILDEATAAVDLETDDFIQETIRKEFADCTVLTIAHRINTIMDSDRVLVLEQGEVVEFDSPSILLENRSSLFYGMTRDAGLV